MRGLSVVSWVRQMVADIKRGVPRGRIAGRFHLTLSRMMVDAAVTMGQETGLDRVVLSGKDTQHNLSSQNGRAVPGVKKILQLGAF